MDFYSLWFPSLDADEDGPRVRQAGADGEAGDGVGGQLQGSPVHQGGGHQPGHFFVLTNFIMLFSQIL
jgi:hypothetical protein